MKHHPGVAKAWIHSGLDTTDLASYNITSVTDNAVGQHTFIIGTDMSGTGYFAVCDIFDDGGVALSTAVTDKGVAQMGMKVRNDADTLTDPSGGFLMAAFGDQ
jgi:hypothetical protein